MIAAFVGLFVCIFAAAQEPDFAAIEGKPLFDGKSFEGWEGNLEIFRIEDGAIVGGWLDKPIPHNEFLCTKAEYGDFELTLRVKLVGATTNAGVQLRTKRIPDHHEVSGYQADLGGPFWGALYDESRRNKILASPSAELRDRIVKKDDWNDYRIRCVGKRIQIWLNGEQTVDYTEQDEGIPERGIICVQIHGGAAGEAWYKDIVIKAVE